MKKLYIYTFMILALFLGCEEGTKESTPAPHKLLVFTAHLSDSSNSGSKDDLVTNVLAPTITGTVSARSVITVAFKTSDDTSMFRSQRQKEAGRYSIKLEDLLEGINNIKVTATDEVGDSYTTVVLVNIETTDQAETEENQAVEIDVLSNDTAPDGTTGEIVDFSQPTHGFVEITDKGRLLYVPNTGYFGEDTFVYEGRDSRVYRVNVVIYEDKQNADKVDTKDKNDTNSPDDTDDTNKTQIDEANTSKNCSEEEKRVYIYKPLWSDNAFEATKADNSSYALSQETSWITESLPDGGTFVNGWDKFPANPS